MTDEGSCVLIDELDLPIQAGDVIAWDPGLRELELLRPLADGEGLATVFQREGVHILRGRFEGGKIVLYETDASSEEDVRDVLTRLVVGLDERLMLRPLPRVDSRFVFILE